MPEAPTVTLHTELPPKLAEALRALVVAGWYPDLDAAVRDALQRFADSHQDALMEKFVREDVEWGLHGEE